MKRHPIWWALVVAAGLYVLAHPYLPEFILAVPLAAAGVTIALTSGANLLWRRVASDAASLIGLAVGIALAPLAAWPLATAPFLRRDLGSRRWAFAGLLLAVVVAAGVLSPSFQSGAPALESMGAAKLTEAVRLMPTIVASVIMPWETPLLGTSRSGNPMPGLLLVAGVLGLLATLIVAEKRSDSRKLLWLGAASFMAPFLPALFGQPHPGLAWPFVVICTIGLVHLGGSLSVRLAQMPAGRTAASLASAALLVALTIPALTVTSARWATWADTESTWQALIDENPLTPYRWDYAQHLKETGDEKGFLREALAYLSRNGTDKTRQLDLALWFLEKGNDAAALHHLKKAGDAVDAPDEGGKAALLGLYERMGEWDSYLRIAKSVPEGRDDLHFQIARAAFKSDKVKLGEQHLRRALDAERPSIDAIYLAYRRLLRAQDIQALNSLGERTQALYPENALGYAICGKAAKITRDDEKVIDWYERSLAKNPDQADLHFDLGLIHHGRKGQQERAANHYAKVLELHPAHPRRNVLRNWISSLRAEATPNAHSEEGK